MDARVHRPVRPIRAIAPLGKQLAQPGVAELLFALLITLLLQHQRLIEHEPAGAGEAAHLPLLPTVWHQFVFEGLEALHVVRYTLGL